ncbi:MAG: class I SAM-dependent methyltransferase [Mycobacterium sp.]|nr:class I SAM-dependent methyltransferase [Mycobacterium sp.]MBV9723309.1 class I SAM-dependent methyltransferase [Mycobacterium sp.]
MTHPPVDWDAAYRHEAAPPWSIGRPQPELATLIDQGKVRGDVLDAGCGHAALSLDLAARGYTVVGLDASETAVAAASAAAAEQGLTTATFAQADITSFGGYPPGSEGRFSTILDSGCLHSLPIEKRQDYLQSISRAASRGASLYILAFAAEAFGDEEAADRPGPRGLTEAELRTEVSTLWEVDDIRPAKVYGNDSPPLDPSQGHFANLDHDNEGHFVVPGLLLSAHNSIS